MNRSITPRTGKRARPSAPWKTPDGPSDQSFEERRLAVLRKAAELFWRRGYHETSFDVLAAALGITKPTVYYYVKSKQHCLAEIARLGQEGAMHAVRHVAGMQASGLDRLIYFFHQYIDVVTSDFGKCIGIARKHLTDKEQREIVARIEWADQRLYKLFSDAIADGSIAVTDKRVVYELVFGSLNWLSEWYRPDGSLTQVDVAQAHVASLVKLLKNSEDRPRQN